MRASEDIAVQGILKHRKGLTWGGVGYPVHGPGFSPHSQSRGPGRALARRATRSYPPPSAPRPLPTSASSHSSQPHCRGALDAPSGWAAGERAGELSGSSGGGAQPAGGGRRNAERGKGKRRAGGRQQPARPWGPAGKRVAPGWVYPLAFLRPNPGNWRRARAAPAQRLDSKGYGTAGRTLPPPSRGFELGPKAALKGRGKWPSSRGDTLTMGTCAPWERGLLRRVVRGVTDVSQNFKRTPTLPTTPGNGATSLVLTVAL